MSVEIMSILIKYRYDLIQYACIFVWESEEEVSA